MIDLTIRRFDTMRTIFAEYNPQRNSIDEPLEYAKLYLDGTMQIWVDADDTLYL